MDGHPASLSSDNTSPIRQFPRSPPSLCLRSLLGAPAPAARSPRSTSSSPSHPILKRPFTSTKKGSSFRTPHHHLTLKTQKTKRDSDSRWSTSGSRSGTYARGGWFLLKGKRRGEARWKAGWDGSTERKGCWEGCTKEIEKRGVDGKTRRGEAKAKDGSRNFSNRTAPRRNKERDRLYHGPTARRKNHLFDDTPCSARIN